MLEHLQVIGHKEALDFVRLLADGHERIGEREIREIHSLVMKGQGNGNVGAYRNLDVMAAGNEFRYPSWLSLPERMVAFAGTLVNRGEHPVVHAARAHLGFVTIHSFQDGNGRVGRLLMNLLLLRAGYPIAIIPVERRAEYLDALVAAQTQNDEAPLRTLIADATESSLREVLAACMASQSLRQRNHGVLSQVLQWLSERS